MTSGTWCLEIALLVRFCHKKNTDVDNSKTTTTNNSNNNNYNRTIYIYIYYNHLYTVPFKKYVITIFIVSIIISGSLNSSSIL